MPYYLRHKDVFIPHFTFMVEREMNNKKADVTAKFEGGSIGFVNELREADRTRFDIGVGFTLYTTSNLTLLATYNYEFRLHGHGHHGFIKFNYKF